MGWYVLKRLLQAIPLLIGIATVSFFIAHLAPGESFRCTDGCGRAEFFGIEDPAALEHAPDRLGCS